MFCFARDAAVGVDVWSLMRQVFRSVRPLSYWHTQLRSAAQLQPRQPVLLKSFYALARTRARPVLQSGHCCAHRPLRCAQISAFASIVRAGSVDHMHTNRLASEESPYLLQHQHNPVRGADPRLLQRSRTRSRLVIRGFHAYPTTAVLY